VQAARAGVQLNSFRLEDYGIAYGYSPVLVALPATLAQEGQMVRAFLAATARGYALAAAEPRAAAALLLEQVAADTAACPLPEPLELAMLEESQVGRWGCCAGLLGCCAGGAVLEALRCSAAARARPRPPAPAPRPAPRPAPPRPLPQAALAGELLDASGRWGAMEAGRWDAFLDWLSASGLLTSKVQSRGPASEATASLDALRAGDVGEPIPRDCLRSADLFTNSFLP
jgi:hypothetical protein